MLGGGAAFGVEAQELVRHLANSAADSGLGLGKGLAAQTIEPGMTLAAGVLLDCIQTVNRDEQLVGICVADHQQVDRDAVDGTVLEPLVAADAVLVVHHKVAGDQSAQILEMSSG